jgi:hypothetical protein
MVGASIDACIEYGQNLFQHTIGGPPDTLGLAGTEIIRFYLLNHDESGDMGVVHNGHMEGEAPICVGEGTDDSETCMFIEQGVAHNQSRPAAPLLMSGPGAESNGNEVAFLRNIGCHLPDLSADGFSPAHFPGLVILWDAGHQFL